MRNWQPAHTAPENGSEFYFTIRGSDDVHVGSTRCPGMVVWHPRTDADRSVPEPPYGGLSVS